MDFTKLDTSARVREWQYLTGAEISAADREHTVVLVTCSPLEVHGPHLPTAADIIEGEGIALRALELMCERDERLQFLHLPPVWVAADVLPQTGSVMFRARTVERVMTDLGRSLAAQGFKHIWVSNFHGGPRHFLAIEKAAARTNRRYGAKMISLFSLLTAQFTDGGSDLSGMLAGIDGLDAELLVNDTHAGAVETSLLLLFTPELVKPEYAQLPVNVVDFTGKEAVAMKGGGGFLDRVRGFTKILKYFETETWCGSPALASREMGVLLNDTLAGFAAGLLMDVYEGRRAPELCYSPFWPFRHLLVNDFLARLFEHAIGYRTQVW